MYNFFKDKMIEKEIVFNLVLEKLQQVKLDSLASEAPAYISMEELYDQVLSFDQFKLWDEVLIS